MIRQLQTKALKNGKRWSQYGQKGWPETYYWVLEIKDGLHWYPTKKMSHRDFCKIYRVKETV